MPSDGMARIPLVGRYFCDHLRIKIAAFGKGGTALYRCRACNARVKPWKMDKEYRYEDTDT